MARKAWADLSPNYRRRLERQGLTAKSHAAGRPLRDTVARQQRKTAQSTTSQQTYVTDWLRLFSRDYGLPTRKSEWQPGQPFIGRKDYNAGVKQFLALPLSTQYKAASLQRRMELLYINGDAAGASRLYARRPKGVPDWMFFYHHAFR